MSTVSYFKNAQNFVAKDITFNSLNTYLSGIDGKEIIVILTFLNASSTSL